MARYPRYLTKIGMDRIARHGKGKHRGDPIDRAYELSLKFLAHIFGDDWVDRYIIGRSPNHYNMHPQNDEQSTQALDRHKDDVISMCELILFGQKINNVDAIIARIMLGEIEAGLFEIEVARILFNQGLKFCVKAPTGVYGADYDFDIFLPDGTAIAADAKCKVSSTRARDSTILDSLEAARKQLPKNKPGVIFISYPERWIDENSLKEITPFVMDRFLKRTSRIHVVVVVLKYRIIEYYHTLNGVIFHVITNSAIDATELKDPFKNLNEKPNPVPSIWSLVHGTGGFWSFPATRWIDPKSL